MAAEMAGGGAAPGLDDRAGTEALGREVGLEGDAPVKSLENDGSGFSGVDVEEVERCSSDAPGRTSPVSRHSSDLGFPPRGLEHCNTAPVRSISSERLIERQECRVTRCKTEKNEHLKHDWKLDKLSEHEKKKIMENLVKIQKDGTVEVDVADNVPVASELLELDSVGTTSADVESSQPEFTRSVPKLKIAMLVVGTRGDVQPFVAFAKRLQEFGHQVRLATHANFRPFVKSAGVSFYPLGGDPRILAGYLARNKGFLISGPAEISIQRKQLKAIIDSLLPACIEPDLDSGAPFRAQAIIANPPAYGHAHVAEALGIPLHIFFTMPWTGFPVCWVLSKSLSVAHISAMLVWLPVILPPFSMFCLRKCIEMGRPTNEFPHPLARVSQSAGYRLSYLVVDLVVWWVIRDLINNFRKRKLKLPPIAYFSTYHGSISHLPTGYMWSPHLVPKPLDWGTLVDVVGFCFLDLGTRYQPSEEFEHWLQRGPKPIYIGFGSMPLEDARKTTGIIMDALKETGQRGIIGQGWGNLGAIQEFPDDVFLIEDCPHDWLFPQCVAVVHHGGAGTTAAGLRAGCPTAIVPFFGDQFFWGDRIHEKRLGPSPIPISQLNVEQLSSAIRFMLEPEVKLRVMELAKLIQNEDGVGSATDAFHRQLPPELPIPRTTLDEQQDAFHWILTFLKKWCCFPWAQ